MIRTLVAAMLIGAAGSAAAEPLTFFNGRLFIPATVNGVQTEALLDSGAEGTIVDPVLAANAKFAAGTPQVIKGSAGSEQARIVEGVTLNAIRIELHPEAVVVLDLSNLSSRLIKRPTQAIIGRELFDAARLRIDINGGTISAVDRAMTPPGEKLALTAHAGIEGIPVRANRVEAQAEFDLGNGSDVMISRELAKKLHLKILGKRVGGGIGGAIQRDFVRLSRLKVAGRTFRNLTATIDDQPSHNDMNVGTSILKNFLITTDFKDRSVWLAPLAGAK